MTITCFRKDQISKSSLVIVNNKVYDIEEFIPNHPGGRVIKTYLGQDATDAFNAFHPDSTVEVLANYYVGDLIPDDCGSTSCCAMKTDGKKTSFGDEIDLLRRELKEFGLFESSKLYYIWKVLSNYGILGASIYLTLAGYTVAGAIFLGIFWQQSGWLAHDFLHHQVFKNRNLNDAMGYLLGNIGQGFSVNWWKNKHNTHHAKPNIHEYDPDIDTLPLLGWSTYSIDESSSLLQYSISRFVLINQHFLYFLFLTFARLSWCFQSILCALTEDKNTLVELPTLLLHWSLYFWLVSKCQSPAQRIMFLVLSQGTCGLLLALVFSLNHNGRPIYLQQETETIDFYRLQVVTGRNIYSSLFNDWFTGGLNHQIEHHLFPSLPRHNFHKIRGRVQELCVKYDVPYHITGIYDGTIEVLEKLRDIGSYCKSKCDHLQKEE